MHSRLVIRADAGNRMGTGHVMRCIALGQAWQDSGGEVLFFTCCDTAPLLQRLRDENFTVIELKNPNEFLSRLSSYLCPPTSDLWVVLDGYHFDLDCQRAIREAGYKLLLIDDYNHLQQYECDILLNQNINALELDYHLNPDAEKLLGTQYALLRREFFQPLDLRCSESAFGIPQKKRPEGERQKTEEKVPRVGKNILVTLGGADPDNVTLKVIEALQQFPPSDFHAKIIVGPANSHQASLENAIQHSSANIQLISSVKDMTELMRWADLAVSAAGSTCWELCCLGVPLLTVILAENQEGLADVLEKNGASQNIGWHDAQDVVGFSKAVHAVVQDAGLRSRLAHCAQELVDGRGTARVAEIMENRSESTR